MSSAKTILVKESLDKLKRMLKESKPMIAPRLRMLIAIKQQEGVGISKRELAELIGVNHNSIQTWRTLYELGGITVLCHHNKTGFRPSVFEEEEHLAIKEKLNDPNNGLRGYKELQAWIENEFKKDVKYNTLLKYCIRNFGSKSKVARKSHINKDIEAVATFKKTLHPSVKKKSKKRKNTLQK